MCETCAHKHSPGVTEVHADLVAEVGMPDLNFDFRTSGESGHGLDAPAGSFDTGRESDAPTGRGHWRPSPAEADSVEFDLQRRIPPPGTGDIASGFWSDSVVVSKTGGEVSAAGPAVSSGYLTAPGRMFQLDRQQRYGPDAELVRHEADVGLTQAPVMPPPGRPPTEVPAERMDPAQAVQAELHDQAEPDDRSRALERLGIRLDSES
jgi:hypothetical protein